MSDDRKDDAIVPSKDTSPGITRWEEERDFAKVLMLLRRDFETNESVRECLTANTREEKRQGILHFTSHYAFGHGGVRVLERAVDYILDELERMVAAGHGQYLVDTTTGMPVGPMTKDMVYQQPDFVNEAGVLVKGKKVVNPTVAAALGLARQEQHRTELALQSAGGSLAFEHLRDPESILRIAREELDRLQIPESELGEEVKLEVGREQSDGVFQSPNRSFHRHELYGRVLARRVVTAGYTECSLIDLQKKQDSKSRWFEVTVRVRGRSGDGTPTAPLQ